MQVFKALQFYCLCAVFVIVVNAANVCDPDEVQHVCRDPEERPRVWVQILHRLCQHCGLLDRCVFRDTELANREAAELEQSGAPALDLLSRKEMQDLIVAALFQAHRLSMTVDCPRGVIALLMALYDIDPVMYDQSVVIQRLMLFEEIVIQVSLHADALAESVFYSFMVKQVQDISPFPLSTQPILALSQWQQLVMHPVDPKCNPMSLPSDCAAEGLGIDWAAFLVESCANCNRYFCYEPKNLLDMASNIVEQAWAERYSGRALPCTVGYFTALMILSKHNSVKFSTFSAVDAKVLGNDDGAMMLHVHFQKMNNHTLYHLVPFVSLSPFPLDLAAFHAILSWKTALDYPGWHFDVAARAMQHLKLAGISCFLMPGDSSLQPLNDTLLTGENATNSMTLFVPIELRRKAMPVLGGIFGEHTHLVDRNGLVQVGAIPYESAAKSLSFHVFCVSCVYTPVIFYATGDEFLFPLHLWRPCRIPLQIVFPLQIHRIGDNEVLLPLYAEVDLEEKTARMQYVPDEPALPKFSGNGVCRQQVMSLKEVQDLEAGESGPWFPTIQPEFDIRQEVKADMSPVDLKMLRQLSQQPGLVKFLDKIQLKQWCRDRGIDIPHIYYMSNASSDVPPDLLKLQSFVAKPAHLADSSYIYVIRDGVNLINGNMTSADEVQKGLHTAFSTTNLNDWATEHASPGIIIEELVEPAISPGDSSDGRGLYTTPDEFKCHTVWGELFFCQWVWVSHMSTDLNFVISSDDWPLNQGHIDFGIPEFANSGYVFRDGSCVLCARPPPVDWQALVNMAETVATGSDYLRVDIFIKEGRPVLNEVTITFAAMIGFQPQLASEMSRRWLEGYEWLCSR